MKSRKVKEFDYQDKYGMIPLDFEQRLWWLVDQLKLSDKKMEEILNTRNMMMNSLYFNDFNIILFEEPEGAMRPRTRIINKNNVIGQAIHNSQFVHIYSPKAKEDSVHMQRLGEMELYSLEQLMCTPCIVEYCAYHKIPSTFNAEDKILAEIGLIRPIIKPDWDNVGKKYSDMSNHNIWLDDSFVIDGTVRKFYSVLPRVEIRIKYLNILYNKYQYNSVSNRKDFIQKDLNVDYFKKGDKI